MNLALDTNAYNALADGECTLVERVREVERIGMPLMVLGELRFAFLNGTKTSTNEENLARFLAGSRVMILEPTEQTTSIYGEISVQICGQGRALQQNDIWIAALCKQYGYVLATRDRAFSSVLGLRLFAF